MTVFRHTRVVAFLDGLLISLALFAVAMFGSPSSAMADKLDVTAPDNSEQATIELAYGEAAELTVYLKSFGDLVDGLELTLIDAQDELVGKTLSDTYGVAKFSNLAPGHYRVTLERKKNDRGGWSTAGVGDLQLKKLRKQ